MKLQNKLDKKDEKMMEDGVKLNTNTTCFIPFQHYKQQQVVAAVATDP